MLLFAVATFVLANLDSFIKGGRTMNNVIKVTPNSKGEIFITLYGIKYQIVIEEPKKPAKAKAE